MNIEEYYLFLEWLSTQKIKIGESLFHNFENLLQEGNATAIESINFRAQFIGEHEVNIALAYFPVGHFTKYCKLKRMACFCVGLEAEYIKGILNLQRRCELYSEDQPLFKANPSLFQHVRDRELVDYSVFQRINDSEIIHFNNQYGYIDGYVPLTVLGGVSYNRPQSPIYIRVNPHLVYSTQPPQKIFESQLIPPNPKWWHELSIYNRSHEGCSFFLDESVNPKDNYDEYWEYHCQNIRRLDVIAKRDGNGNLSMMMEELIVQKNIVSPSERYIVSRMIHLDTDAAIGNSFHDSTLNHLDLAMNVYTENNAKNRLLENLANGEMITDASFRTHLLRVENINFSDLFVFAYSFFKSKTLVDEWKETQFR